MPLACPGRLICARLPKRTRRTVAANFLEEFLEIRFLHDDEDAVNVAPQAVGCLQLRHKLLPLACMSSTSCGRAHAVGCKESRLYAVFPQAVVRPSCVMKTIQRNAPCKKHCSSYTARDAQYLHHPSWLLLHLNMVSRLSRFADWRQFCAPSHTRLKKRLRSSGQAPYSTVRT